MCNEMIMQVKQQLAIDAMHDYFLHHFNINTICVYHCETTETIAV